ncbi:MAG: YHS domain-containing protein, partial [Acidobacteriota bacterium]|nr:YHS domain-containing protein [Acidobacteriota bacterium]
MKDLICGMEVNPETARAKAEFDGHSYYFCSSNCEQKFRADPAKYVSNVIVAPPTDPSMKQEPKPSATQYTCPMHPEVVQQKPGNCPKCGMALEPVTFMTSASKTEYVCPMHPQIVRDAPGSCPICGMALEPRTVTAEEEKNPELVEMTRRFWVDTVLTIPVLVVAMAEYFPSLSSLISWASPKAREWFELVLATPIVLWGGWPFFVRGWRSIINRSL